MSLRAVLANRPRRRSRTSASILITAVLLVGSPPALAQTKPTSAALAEARMRFDLGIKLFNDGENAGALAEFDRAYHVVPNPLVLYNIGLVYAAMGRPVDSVAALDQVLAIPGSVTGDNLARARDTRAEQARRIAELAIVTNVPAMVDVDGVTIGQSPLAAPLKVPGGLHRVGAVATGYAVVRKEVTVAGGATARVELVLLPLATTQAHATVHTHLPDAEVVVDGQPAGITPLAESLTLSPGSHTIELRREGYRAASTHVSLGEGASADVDLEPAEDAAVIRELGGALALDVSEPGTVVTVDGTSRGVYGQPLPLAPGLHKVLVEHGGFEATILDARVVAHRVSTLGIVLDPTPETRAAYDHRRSFRHQLGIGTAVAGAGVLAGSIAFIVWNANEVSSFLGPYNAALKAQTTKAPPNCDGRAGDQVTICNNIVDADYAPLRSAENLTPIGYLGLGVGVAAVTTGLVIYFTAGRADRFHPHAPTTTSFDVLPWASPRGGGMGATVRF
jgi:hypothetical protein